MNYFKMLLVALAATFGLAFTSTALAQSPSCAGEHVVRYNAGVQSYCPALVTVPAVDLLHTAMLMPRQYATERTSKVASLVIGSANDQLETTSFLFHSGTHYTGKAGPVNKV